MKIYQYSCRFFLPFFQTFDRGFQGDLYSKLWGGQTIRDTRNLMESNSLPYECIFHLVCIMLSANAQFSHTKACVLFGWFALVYSKNLNNRAYPNIRTGCTFLSNFVIVQRKSNHPWQFNHVDENYLKETTEFRKKYPCFTNDFF